MLLEVKTEWYFEFHKEFHETFFVDLDSFLISGHFDPGIFEILLQIFEVIERVIGVDIILLKLLQNNQYKQVQENILDNDNKSDPKHNCYNRSVLKTVVHNIVPVFPCRTLKKKQKCICEILKVSILCDSSIVIEPGYY